MIILFDTREQKPWQFPPHIQTTKQTLRDGDYSVEGYPDIRIERKSLSDLASCVTDRSLPRFLGQLQRLRKYKYRALVVETTMDQLMAGKYGSPLPPHKVLQRLMDAVCRFKVLLFLTDRKNAAALATTFMQSAIKQLDQD